MSEQPDNRDQAQDSPLEVRDPDIPRPAERTPYLGDVGPTDKVPPPVESHAIEKLEASHRGRLAFGPLIIFAITIVLSFVSLMWGPGPEATKGWLDLALPAETALLGAGLAFYFATRK